MILQVAGDTAQSPGVWDSWGPEIVAALISGLLGLFGAWVVGMKVGKGLQASQREIEERLIQYAAGLDQERDDKSRKSERRHRARSTVLAELRERLNGSRVLGRLPDLDAIVQCFEHPHWSDLPLQVKQCAASWHEQEQQLDMRQRDWEDRLCERLRRFEVLAPWLADGSIRAALRDVRSRPRQFEQAVTVNDVAQIRGMLPDRPEQIYFALNEILIEELTQAKEIYDLSLEADQALAMFREAVEAEYRNPDV